MINATYRFAPPERAGAAAGRGRVVPKMSQLSSSVLLELRVMYYRATR